MDTQTVILLAELATKAAEFGIQLVEIIDRNQEANEGNPIPWSAVDEQIHEAEQANARLHEALQRLKDRKK